MANKRKYSVKQMYYPNGKVDILLLPACENEKSREKHTVLYDEYIDIFDSKEQATRFYKDTLQC